MVSLVTLVALVALGATACGGDDSGDDGDGTAERTTTTKAAATTAAGPTSSTLPPAEGDPVVIGLINQEDTPAGSFPDLRVGAEIAVEYLNAELGGVDGHPLELRSCKTQSTPESSQACANELAEAGVAAVIAGQDFQMAAAYPILQEAGIPVVGITPVTAADYTAAGAYYFSGGGFTHVLGLLRFMADYLDVGKVALLYQDDAAGQATIPLLTPAFEELGIEFTSAGEKADAPDYTPLVAAVQGEDPDAIFALFGPQGCSGILKAADTLGLDVPVVTTGACYSPEVLDSAGDAADDSYYSLGPDPDDPGSDPDVPKYRYAVETYGDGAELTGLTGAGFSDVMTLWFVLRDLGYEGLTAATVGEALAGTTEGELFMGEPWTCGQIAAMPAICETHIRVYRYAGGELEDATGGEWITGADLFG